MTEIEEQARLLIHRADTYIRALALVRTAERRGQQPTDAALRGLSEAAAAYETARRELLEGTRKGGL